MTTSARHTMSDDGWRTPVPYVHAARAVMGGIDCDPASSAEANQVIQAGIYYTATRNGLLRAWGGRVFCNPPGGLVKPFWEKFVYAFEDDRDEMTEGIWVGYSVEQLQTLQNTPCGVSPIDLSICIPNRRIAFVESEGRRQARLASGKKVSGPSHANYVTYLGPHQAQFLAVFNQFGRVVLR